MKTAIEVGIRLAAWEATWQTAFVALANDWIEPMRHEMRRRFSEAYPLPSLTDRDVGDETDEYLLGRRMVRL